MSRILFLIGHTFPFITPWLNFDQYLQVMVKSEYVTSSYMTALLSVGRLVKILSTNLLAAMLSIIVSIFLSESTHPLRDMNDGDPAPPSRHSFCRPCSSINFGQLSSICCIFLACSCIAPSSTLSTLEFVFSTAFRGNLINILHPQLQLPS